MKLIIVLLIGLSEIALATTVVDPGRYRRESAMIIDGAQSHMELSLKEIERMRKVQVLWDVINEDLSSLTKISLMLSGVKLSPDIEASELADYLKQYAYLSAIKPYLSSTEARVERNLNAAQELVQSIPAFKKEHDLARKEVEKNLREFRELLEIREESLSEFKKAYIDVKDQEYLNRRVLELQKIRKDQEFAKAHSEFRRGFDVTSYKILTLSSQGKTKEAKEILAGLKWFLDNLPRFFEPKIENDEQRARYEELKEEAQAYYEQAEGYLERAVSKPEGQNASFSTGFGGDGGGLFGGAFTFFNDEGEGKNDSGPKDASDFKEDLEKASNESNDETEDETEDGGTENSGEKGEKFGSSGQYEFIETTTKKVIGGYRAIVKVKTGDTNEYGQFGVKCTGEFHIDGVDQSPAVFEFPGENVQERLDREIKELVNERAREFAEICRKQGERPETRPDKDGDQKQSFREMLDHIDGLIDAGIGAVGGANNSHGLQLLALKNRNQLAKDSMDFFNGLVAQGARDAIRSMNQAGFIGGGFAPPPGGPLPPPSPNGPKLTSKDLVKAIVLALDLTVGSMPVAGVVWNLGNFVVIAITQQDLDALLTGSDEKLSPDQIAERGITTVAAIFIGKSGGKVIVQATKNVKKGINKIRKSGKRQQLKKAHNKAPNAVKEKLRDNPESIDEFIDDVNNAKGLGSKELKNPNAYPALNDPDVKKRMDRWGKSSDGTNQLVDHSVNRGSKRLSSLERRSGLKKGSLSDAAGKDSDRIADGMKNLDDLSESIKANPDRTRVVGNKKFHWRDGKEKPSEGIVVIESGGKTRTVMPSRRKSFEEMK